MRILAAVFASALMVSNAFAGTQSAPLPAGKPAGVQRAALTDHNFLAVLLGAGVIIGGIALAVSSGDKNNVTTPTTSGTATTGTGP